MRNDPCILTGFKQLFTCTKDGKDISMEQRFLVLT